jgi:hypothetical protein
MELLRLRFAEDAKRKQVQWCLSFFHPRSIDMTLRWHVLAALLTSGLMAALLPLTFADEKQPADASKEAADSNSVIEISTTAYKTMDFGRENKSPEALVVAAIMLRSLKTAKIEPITEVPTDDDGKPITEKALATRSFTDEADDLFEEARGMAIQLKLVGFDAFIDSAKSRATRAVVGGAKSIHRRIGPGHTEHFHFKFENEKPAEVAIHASHTVHVFAEHENNHVVWINGDHRQHAVHERPHGKPKGLATVHVSIHNPDKKTHIEYDLRVR